MESQSEQTAHNTVDLPTNIEKRSNKYQFDYNNDFNFDESVGVGNVKQHNFELIDGNKFNRNISMSKEEGDSQSRNISVLKQSSTAQTASLIGLKRKLDDQFDLSSFDFDEFQNNFCLNSSLTNKTDEVMIKKSRISDLSIQQEQVEENDDLFENYEIGVWTPEEENELLSFGNQQDQSKPINWSEIAAILKKTPRACLKKHRSLQVAGLKKDSFYAEEDEIVRENVESINGQNQSKMVETIIETSFTQTDKSINKSVKEKEGLSFQTYCLGKMLDTWSKHERSASLQQSNKIQDGMIINQAHNGTANPKQTNGILNWVGANLSPSKILCIPTKQKSNRPWNQEDHNFLEKLIMNQRTFVYFFSDFEGIDWEFIAMALKRNVSECTQKYAELKENRPFSREEDLIIIEKVKNWTGNQIDLWPILEKALFRNIQTLQSRWTKLFISNKEKRKGGNGTGGGITKENEIGETAIISCNETKQLNGKHSEESNERITDIQEADFEINRLVEITLDDLITKVQSANRKLEVLNFTAEEDQFIHLAKEEWGFKKGVWVFLSNLLNRSSYVLMRRWHLISSGKTNKIKKPPVSKIKKVSTVKKDPPARNVSSFKKVPKKDLDSEINRIVGLTVNHLIQKVQFLNGEKRKHIRFSAEEDEVLIKAVGDSGELKKGFWAKLARQLHRKNGVIKERWNTLKRKETSKQVIIRKTFSIEEDEFIWRTKIEWGENSGVWPHLAKVLERRSSCVSNRWRLLENIEKKFPNFKTSSWDKKEILQLLEFIVQQASRNNNKTEYSISWNAISEQLNRNPFDCKAQFEYQTLIRQDMPFTKEEDKIIIEEVDNKGEEEGIWSRLQYILCRDPATISEQWNKLNGIKHTGKRENVQESGVEDSEKSELDSESDLESIEDF